MPFLQEMWKFNKKIAANCLQFTQVNNNLRLNSKF